MEEVQPGKYNTHQAEKDAGRHGRYAWGMTEKAPAVTGALRAAPAMGQPDLGGVVSAPLGGMREYPPPRDRTVVSPCSTATQFSAGPATGVAFRLLIAASSFEGFAELSVDDLSWVAPPSPSLVRPPHRHRHQVFDPPPSCGLPLPSQLLGRGSHYRSEPEQGARR